VVSQGGEGIELLLLLRQADIALCRAKAAGKGRYTVFAAAMQVAVQERADLEAGLRQAVERGECVAYFQPTIDLRTGRLVGAEALVRWQRPGEGPVPLGRFIPLAEETGLIVPLGRQVLEQACRALARWHELYPAAGAALHVNVNLSVRQLQEPGLVGEVTAILAAAALPPACLVLEVSESAMLQDTEAVRHTLLALKAVGVQLALDDFGTGYSSLSYLHQFPFDILKIDKAFIDPLAEAARAGAGAGAADPAGGLAGTIIKMAQGLGLQTVAEGIEQAEQLAQLGCVLEQGYYFARPLPAAEFEALLHGAQRAGAPWSWGQAA
jgi:EAL domain-containing protein (putative c-di-GMP-specific phosphodiesterase class I)